MSIETPPGTEHGGGGIVLLFLALMGFGAIAGCHLIQNDFARAKAKYHMGEKVQFKLPEFYQKACDDVAYISTYQGGKYSLSPVECRVGFETHQEFFQVSEEDILKVLSE